MVFRAAVPRRRGVPLAAVAFVTWLCFLPNAPYLVTDFIHLQPRGGIPLWFDVVLFGSFGATGVLLGYVSVADVQSALAARAGRAVAALVAVGSLLLCGFGIYLGRFLRWNSWDVVTSPLGLGRQIAGFVWDPLSHPQTWAVSAVYGIALVLGYAALWGVASTFRHGPETPGLGRPRLVRE
jgi:uncharacterized membrane protein